jgi:transcriptional regulator with XRE-family HTH domain
LFSIVKLRIKILSHREQQRYRLVIIISFNLQKWKSKKIFYNVINTNAFFLLTFPKIVNNIKIMKRETSEQHLAFYVRLGENIRKCRQDHNLSQEKLANLAGLTRTSLTNIEKGRQHPPLHTLCEIIEHLQVDIADLLPRPDAIKAPSDIKALAGKQVRGDDELEYIESAIKEKSHGDTKTQNRGDSKRASGQKRH